MRLDGVVFSGEDPLHKTHGAQVPLNLHREHLTPHIVRCSPLGLVAGFQPAAANKYLQESSCIIRYQIEVRRGVQTKNFKPSDWLKYLALLLWKTLDNILY